jgi:pSer/pThr/pTyr-binding forkhead associated (FHA) protein
MVQLKICSGKMAGNTQVVRHFPFRIGRSRAAHLRVEEDGVWDEHLELDFDPAQGFILSTPENAIASVNGWPIQAVILRNGDLIEIGALKIRFWLGETRQAGLRLQEWLPWITLLAICALQAALIYWLMK